MADGESPEDWFDGIEPETSSVEQDSTDEPPRYQVLHKHGDQFRKVAEVESRELISAVMRTTHGFGEARWQDIPGVHAEPGEHRSTDLGDVVMDPEGNEFKLGMIRVCSFDNPGFVPTQVIHEQAYSDYLDEMERRDEYYRGFDQDEPEVTREEIQTLLPEARDDASQRPLWEKGVDYSHEPGGLEYADMLRDAAAPGPVEAAEMKAVIVDVERGWPKQETAARPEPSYDQTLKDAADMAQYRTLEKGRSR